MEIPGGKERKCLVCVYEIIGMIIFMLCYNWGAAASTQVGHAVCICFGMFTAHIICNQVSGAHFNPAVTIAILIKEGKIKANCKLASFIIFA